MQCILQDQKSISSWNELEDKPSLSQVATSGDYDDLSNTPTKLSQFENDRGFMTRYTETDPTVPNWAKQANKPTYTYNEVGAAQAAAGLPTGGTIGQILEKTGTADYQIGWRPPMSNPNLLDNWYFKDPINQRGQTEYTKAGYTIDRWHMLYDDTRLTLTEKGIVISGSIGHAFEDEMFNQLLNKTVTLSFLTASNELGVLTRVVDTSTMEWERATTTHLQAYVYRWGPFASGRLHVLIGLTNSDTITNNDEVTVVAAKLELGDHQTLAHQDASGNWVLNDSPNKAQELEKCRRYYQTISVSGICYYDTEQKIGKTNMYASISPPMRANPTCTALGFWSGAIGGMPTGGWNYDFSAANPTFSASSTDVRMGADIFDEGLHDIPRNRTNSCWCGVVLDANL